MSSSVPSSSLSSFRVAELGFFVVHSGGCLVPSPAGCVGFSAPSASFGRVVARRFGVLVHCAPRAAGGFWFLVRVA